MARNPVRIEEYSSDIHIVAEAPPGASQLAIVSLRVAHYDTLRATNDGLTERAVEVFQQTLAGLLGRFPGAVAEARPHAVMLAFDDVLAAVHCVLELQTALASATWPQGLERLPGAETQMHVRGTALFRGLRVAVGIGVGSPMPRKNPLTGLTTYVGASVQAAADLAAMAAGGQILVTEAALAALGPAGQTVLAAQFKALGRASLPGSAAAIQVFEVTPRGLVGREFAPLRSTVRVSHNLPAVVSGFVGRDAELQALDEVLSRGGRVTTVTGPGGAGKTRITEEYAARHLREYDGAGGVWFIDLVASRELEDIVEAVGGVLDVPLGDEETSAAATERVGRALRARGPTLVLLDNCEQVADAAARALDIWSQLAPQASFLATSRRVLGAHGETRFPLGPLNPAEGVRLFAERARAIRPDFVFDQAATADATGIVAALEGNALAIELAASRLATLLPSQILDRLSERLSLLERPQGDAEHRHSALRTTIEWTWRLLPPASQRAVAELAVFRGGFFLGAATALLSDAKDEADALSTVQQLHDWSLLESFVPSGAVGETRYRLYESVRSFGREVLDGSGHGPAVRLRHATWFIESAESWLAGARTASAEESLRRLGLEADNIGAAQRRAARLDPALAIRGALVLEPASALRGARVAVVEVLDQAVEFARDPSIEATTLAQVLLARARTRLRLGTGSGALDDAQQALAIAGESGDKAVELEARLVLARLLRGSAPEHRSPHVKAAMRLAFSGRSWRQRARATIERAVSLRYQGELDEAAHGLAEILDHSEYVGDPRVLADVRIELAAAERVRGRTGAASAYLADALGTCRSLGDWRRVVEITVGLGEISAAEGREDDAVGQLEQAHKLAGDIGDDHLADVACAELGVAALRQRDPDRAIQGLHAAVRGFEARGDLPSVARYVAHLAAAHAMRGDLETAQRALDHAGALVGGHAETPQGAATRFGEAVIALVSAQCVPADAQARYLETVRAVLLAPALLSATQRRYLEREVLRAFPSWAASDDHSLGETVVLAADGMWFQVPGGEKTSLENRVAPRRILGALVAARRATRALTMDDLLEAGWPDERVIRSAGANRVYVAIATLRKLGLGRVLMSGKDGYRLDPDVPVKFV